MCDTCGCNITEGNQHLISAGGKLEKTESGREAVTVLHSLLHENDHTALHNREHFNTQGVVAINLMSSPGAGKTALLQTWCYSDSDYHRQRLSSGRPHGP